MEKYTLKLRVDAFFGDNEMEVSFPKDWHVDVRLMAGHDMPALSEKELRQRLQHPVDSMPLAELAQGKKRACILFDDLTRPTPTCEIVPLVLDELHGAGVTDNQIRFVAATGAHRPMTYPELAAKLGWKIIEKYPVYAHSIWQNLVYVGQTSRGTPVHVNREFASCDLRIGIGCLIPHHWTGFSGGAKIVMPGVSGLDTIVYHHSQICQSGPRGQLQITPARSDIEEAARLAQLDFVVDVVLNNRREIVGLFAGDPVAEYRAAATLAHQVYATKPLRECDILVLNAYPCDCKMDRALWATPVSLRNGGDVVLVACSQNGQSLHQILGRFGTDFGGRMFNPDQCYRCGDEVGRLLVLAPHLSIYERSSLRPPGEMIWCTTWPQILEMLKARNGPGAKVGVYPYVGCQFAASERILERAPTSNR